ncbi:MAG: hypothetical protein AAF687_11430 [Pseudomonadota bacterium]
MRPLILLATSTIALAACTPAKEQAEQQCAEQAKTLPGSVDGEQFCDCLTGKIPDDASVSEAEDILMAEASTCISEQVSNAMSEIAAPTSEATPTGE